MKNILLITSSLRGADSYSTKVARELVDRLLAENPDATVKIRDLAMAPPPVLDASNLGALFATDRQQLPHDQLSLMQRADEYIADLFEADAIVVASGMINFGVPTVLKSWLDLILRAGVTFRYTESGPEGLVTGRSRTWSWHPVESIPLVRCRQWTTLLRIWSRRSPLLASRTFRW